MSSQGPRLLLAISWILRLKKDLLVSLTVFLKLFQFLSFLNVLYLSRDWLHSLFHHFLECFVILTHLAFLPHAHSMFDARRLTMSLSLLQSVRLEVLRFLMIVITSLTNMISSLLFFDMDSLLWDALDTNNFYFLSFYFSDFILILFFFCFSFSFGRWRGMWYYSHMTCHMMWHHKPRIWWKDLEDDVRAYVYNMMALSRKWGRYEVVAWTIGQA